MPLRGQLHVDKLLSNVSQKYSVGDHIHDRVFPQLPVKKDSDLIRVHVRNIRLQETIRNEKGLAREASHEYSNTTYQLTPRALKDYISQSEMENNDVGNLRADTVEELTEKMSIVKENEAAALFTSTSFSNNQSLTAAQAWSNDTTVSNPILFMDTAVSTVLKQSGKKPNFSIIPFDSMQDIKNHQSILDRIKYTSSEVTEAMIAQLFDVGEILVSSAQYDTSAEGIAESLSDIWDNHAFVGYKAPRAGMKQMSFGYEISKAGGKMVRRWKDSERMEAEAIEVNDKYQYKIVGSLAGFLIKDLD